MSELHECFEKSPTSKLCLLIIGNVRTFACEQSQRGDNEYIQIYLNANLTVNLPYAEPNLLLRVKVNAAVHVFVLREK